MGLTRGCRILLLSLLLPTAGCSDAATRLGSATEAEARRLLAGTGESNTIEYAPGLWPEGCGGRYEVALSPAVGVGIRCWRRPYELWNAASYATGLDSTLLIVTDSLSVAKAPGESIQVELVREAGRVRIAALR